MTRLAELIDLIWQVGFPTSKDVFSICEVGKTSYELSGNIVVCEYCSWLQNLFLCHYCKSHISLDKKYFKHKLRKYVYVYVYITDTCRNANAYRPALTTCTINQMLHSQSDCNFLIQHALRGRKWKLQRDTLDNLKEGQLMYKSWVFSLPTKVMGFHLTRLKHGR